MTSDLLQTFKIRVKGQGHSVVPFRNAGKKMAKSSINQPHIARLRLNFTCWCSMYPGQPRSFEINFRFNSRWRTASNF